VRPYDPLLEERDPDTEMTAKILEPLEPFSTPVDELTLDASNARFHTSRNIVSIANSLDQYGQRTPIVYQIKDDGTKVIRKGNGTYRAAVEELGWDEIAAIGVEEDDTTATGYAIADNRTGELATWDDDKLFDLLDSLDDETFDATGFTDDEFRELEADWHIEPEDQDEIDDYDESEDTFTLEIEGVTIQDKEKVAEAVRTGLNEAGLGEYELTFY
jgi:ParB-like chromosome segregation protein Spo0J